MSAKLQRGTVAAIGRPTDDTARTTVPVVAVGASAGGLEPIGQLLSNIPPESGVAVVVIQHLDPRGRSALPDILSRMTAKKVELAGHGTVIVPERVYVTPPAAYLSITSGALWLTPTEGKGPNLPIDFFLRSLATACGQRGIGVILSGTGTDGAEGLKALREAGGLTIVQDPGEASYDGMPRHAVTVARPDFVLPVREISPIIVRYVAHNYVKAQQKAGKSSGPEADAQPPLTAFVDALKSRSGKDFALYKPGTLERRIERRMALNGIAKTADYLAMLRASAQEADALYKDVLINVTGFFRDPASFAAVAARVQDALHDRPDDQPFRAWVPACSTGEEAYSLGILLLEQATILGRHIPLQIFATDIDDEALEVARAGVYPESIRADVSADRLNRFFVSENGHFRASADLRRVIAFSRHDVLHDPPFSRLDLVSCRNLLIYLGAEGQQRVLAAFHFALRNGGLLVLGSAESAHAAQALFEPLDEKARIYSRHESDRVTRLKISTIDRTRHGESSVQAMKSAVRRPIGYSETMQHMLLRAYAPAAVMVTRQLEPVQYFGGVDRYLQLMPGDANQDVLSIAREGMRNALQEVIARAFRSRRRVSVRGIQARGHGTPATVTIEAQRIPDEAEDLVLVSFIDEMPLSAPAALPASGAKRDGNSEVASLRQQLAETRRELNRTINELREANDTLKGKNEEGMSLNEEFLAANEELESSREELQSLNEELTTVNSQLQKTLEQQQQTATDLSNLLNSSSVATILLDTDLCIKIFNPRMRDLFSLIETDIGRPLADLLPKFSDPELTADALAARSEGTSCEREIHALSGAWYVRSTMPYRTETGEIRGAVVTFADVSRLKEEQMASEAARAYAEMIVHMAYEPMVAIDENHRVLTANLAFCAEFGFQQDQIGKMSLQDLDSPVLTYPPLLDLIAEFLAHRGGVAKSEIEVTQPSGRQHNWRATVRVFRPPPPQSPIVLLALEDITYRRHVIRQQFQLLIDALATPTIATDLEGRIRFVSTGTERLLGYSTEELVGQPTDMLVSHELRERHAAVRSAFLQKPTRRPMATGLDINAVAKDGTLIPVDIGLCPVDTADGPLIVATIHDLREIRKGEAEREQLRTQLAIDLADMQQLHSIAMRLAGIADLPAVLQEILRSNIELQGADFGSIHLYDPATDALKVVVHQGLAQEAFADFEFSRAGDGSLSGQALEQQTRVVVENTGQNQARASARSRVATMRYRAAQSTPIIGRDNAIIGMLATYFRRPHQFSERDLRLTDLYMRLAAVLIDRAQAEEAVRAARRAADEANKAKSRFLAAAGHDLRQPLQSISLLQGVLEQQVASAQARATLSRLGDATRQMTELIDSLLDLNQIENGAVKLELADLSLASLLNQLVNDFAPLASAKSLELRCVSTSAIIRGDRRLLVRILGNLLSNAIKYTDRGKILVGCRRRGNSLRIEVWDTGVGIAPEKVHAIFDEFYRVDDAGSDKVGLGLGLHIVKRFADFLGCRIDVSSRPGKGSMFALVIPDTASTDAVWRKPPDQEDMAGLPPVILLIEDDATQLQALSSLLQLQGYRVAAASNGAEAMARLREDNGLQPNVVITDFNLPGGLTGTDVIRRVRDELNAEIPALVLSGQNPDTLLSSSKAGELQFLTKPVKPATLLATVEVLVKRAMPDWQRQSAVERRMAVLPVPRDPHSEIAVIDDEPGVRDSVRSLLEADGYKVETFASGEAFLSDPDHGRFRCLITDVSLGGMGGLELQDRLKSQPHRPQMIFFTGSGELHIAVRAMREGAADFLQKPVESATLREAVSRVMRQEPSSLPAASQRADVEDRLATLTKREREIMDRIATGQLNKNIAADLGISERTTEHHRQNVMRKMGVKSLAMLVRMIASAESGD